MKRLRSSFHLSDLKIKDKLALIIIVVSTVICTTTLFQFQYTIRQYNRLLYSQTANSLSFFSDELTYQLDNLESVSAYISFDPTFQDSLNTFNYSEFSSLQAQKARTDILGIFNHYYSSDMVNISVLTQDNTLFWWGKIALNEPNDTIGHLLKQCDESRGRLVWYITDDSTKIVCARKVLYAKNLSLEPLGYLVIQVDLDNMIQSLLKSRYTNGQEFQLFITTKEQIVYPSGHTNYQDSLIELLKDKKSYAIQQIDNKRMFVTFSKLPLSSANWYLSLAVSYDSIFHSLRLLIPGFIISLILAVCVAAALAGNIVKNISIQFHTLIGKMDIITQEGIILSQNQSAGSTDSQDELTLLNTYFDQMIVALKKQIEESYVKELLITQAELKALEQQVNPHFLYNTLNTVNWLAKKAGSKEISVIAESLGSLLQHTLSSKKTMTTIEQELEVVSCYVKIQQIRFDDLLVTTDIDPSTLNTEIPKMTIQPLIENAIYHSQAEPQDEYLLHLSIQRHEHTIKIQVKNSGSSIDPNILEQIKNHTVHPRGNGIGLLNIDSRLRILFGETCHLNFNNKEGMVIVWYEIPTVQSDDFKGKEENHVQIIDC